jgi:hypothetical protein
VLERRCKRQIAQHRAPLFQRQRRDGFAVEPQNVEHVIRAAAVPGDLTVEDRIFDREFRDGGGNLRQVLRQPVAREQLNVTSVLVSEQPDAVELAFEQPLPAAESILRQRGGHGLEPFRHHTARACVVKSEA